MRLGSRLSREDIFVLAYTSLGVGWLSLASVLGWGLWASAAMALVSGLGGVLSGLVRLRPRPLFPWLVLVVAVLLLVSSMREPTLVVGAVPSTYPLLPDLLGFVGHLVAAVGMIALTRTSTARFSLDAALDALVVSALAFLAIWVLLFAPRTLESTLPLLSQLFLATLPAAALFLCAVGLFVTFGRAGVRPSFASLFLTGSFLALLVGDVLFLLAHLGILPLTGSSWNLAWGLCATLFAAAFSHSSLREVVRFNGRAHPSAVQRSVLLSAALLAPVWLLSIHTADLPARVVAGLSALVLVASAVWRLLRLLSSYLSQRNSLTHQVLHDHLTKLPNRSHMEEFLAGHLSAPSLPLGVMFLDLDRFKFVNDSLGHRCGDALLVTVADRLRAALPADVLVSRLGGDEFVVVAPSTSRELLLSQAEAARAALSAPVLLDGEELSVAASVGVVLHTAGETSPDQLVHAADVALYHAKRSGRNRVRLYQGEMEEEAARLVALKSSLPGALSRDEFSLVYQPIVESSSGELAHLEALLRWQHPTLGLVSPAEFIPLAEELGLISSLGSWVLREACSQVVAWRSGPLPGAKVAVNVSARQFARRSFALEVSSLLSELSLPGSALELELTESTLVENSSGLVEDVTTLRSLGVSFALDDFGTGYSSLTYLRSFPVDRVKLDRSFISEITSERGGRLVGSLLSLAAALELDVVAEGVETLEQALRLAELGCTFSQGFFHSSPLTPDLVPQYVPALLGEEHPRS